MGVIYNTLYVGSGIGSLASGIYSAVQLHSGDLEQAGWGLGAAAVLAGGHWALHRIEMTAFYNAVGELREKYQRFSARNV